MKRLTADPFDRVKTLVVANFLAAGFFFPCPCRLARPLCATCRATGVLLSLVLLTHTAERTLGVRPLFRILCDASGVLAAALQ